MTARELKVKLESLNENELETEVVFKDYEFQVYRRIKAIVVVTGYIDPRFKEEDEWLTDLGSKYEVAVALVQLGE